MKSQRRALLFDLDGVIVNTSHCHYLAWKRLADREGIHFDEIINERLKGVSRQASLEIILEKADKLYSENDKFRMMEIKNQWYVDMLASLSHKDVLPGVINLLESARLKNIKTAICSASKSAQLIIEKLNLVDYFDTIVGGNDVTKSKPDPEVFLVAAERLDISPSDCIVFEDSFAGLEAAKAAGMHSIGLGSREILYIADLIYEGMDKLVLKDIQVLFDGGMTDEKSYSSL